MKKDENHSEMNRNEVQPRIKIKLEIGRNLKPPQITLQSNLQMSRIRKIKSSCKIIFY